jgi:hypothetical protein
MAIIANLNVAKQLCSSPDDDMITNARGPTPSSQVTQGDAMIESAILSNTRL